MLDVGWTELVVIAIVLIIVVGPKDLPPMLRTFGKMMSKMRGMATDFRHQFDEALREADLDDVRKTISDAQKLNPANSLREAMNPLRQMGNDIKADLQKATRPDEKPAPVMTPSQDLPPAPEIAASVATPVGAISETRAPVSPASISSSPAGNITPIAPLSPLATDMAIVAKPRKRAAKAKVAVEEPVVTAAPRKRAAKAVAEIATDTPRKRGTAAKTIVPVAPETGHTGETPKSGDDA